MTDAIAIDGLSKRFGAVTAVKNLSLKIPEGSVFGFLGPNGAGKTTTIRMLLGLVRQTAGSASILGFDTLRNREQVAARVGAIVEVPAFYPFMDGGENLRAVALCSGATITAARVKELLSLVGLAGAGKKLVKQYSLGMKQRLGIAAALIGDPPLLFLDEPTNGLDPDGAREMRDLLLGIKQSGRTIFLSSHLLGEVERICTDLATLQNGEVKVQGAVEQLLDHRGYSIRLSSVARALALLDLPAPEDGQDRAGWISIPVDERVIPSILRKLLDAGLDVFDVNAERRTLEALFFEHTQHGSAAEVRS